MFKHKKFPEPRPVRSKSLLPRQRCPICGVYMVSVGRAYSSHMKAHVRAGEARIVRAGGIEATMADYLRRTAGEKFYFEKATPLLDAGKEDS